MDEAKYYRIAVYQYVAYLNDNDEICLSQPKGLNSLASEAGTTFSADEALVCQRLLPSSPAASNDPDPATLEE